MRARIIITIVVLGAAVIAAGASADFSSVNDPRGDTKCLREQAPHKPCSDSERRTADIVRATAGHDGTWLKHTIRVVGKFRSVDLGIDTDSDGVCDFAVLASRGVRRGDIRECGGPGRYGHARIDVHFHSVEVSFSERAIGNPSAYGWRATTLVGPELGSKAEDSVVGGRPHLLTRR